MSNFGTNDTTMTSGVQVAVWVYAGITTGRASAWHYWWLINENTDNEGLLNEGGSTTNPPKRLYTLGNYSKFVRPGYVNVSVSGSPGTTVYVSAYKDPSSGKAVVVAVNASNAAASPMIYMSGGQSITQMTPNVTSASQNLAAGTAIAVSNSTFTASLPAMTVTTFVSN
jgi:O-glycosyl hydrolase